MRQISLYAFLLLLMGMYYGFLLLSGPAPNESVMVRRYNDKAHRYLSPEMVWIRRSELALMQPGDTVTVDFMGDTDEASKSGPQTCIILRKPNNAPSKP